MIKEKYMKDNNEIREWLEENNYENITLFENYDYATAFVGVSIDGRAIYDYEKMIKFLVETEGMTELEAVEWIDYNTIRAISYFENAPIIIERRVYE